MELKVSISTKVKDSKGKEYNSLASLIQSRQAIGSIRNVLKGTEKELGSTYTLMGNILDQAIASEFGALVVPSRSGRGAIFDNIEVTNEQGRLITTGRGSETKSVKVLETSTGLRASGIEVTSGINLSTTKKVITGIKAGIELTPNKIQSSDDYLELADVDFNAQLIDTLITKYKEGQPSIKKYLSTSRSPSIINLKKNFALKQSDIKVAFVTSTGEAKKASIGWTWSQILNPNSSARIVIKRARDNSIIFNVTFSEAMVSKALNKANKASFAQLEKISNVVARQLAELPGVSATSLDIVTRELAKTYNLSYVQGSVFVYQASLFHKPTKQTAQGTAQQFISSAQWTALVQKRLGDTMSRFGEPSAPNLKERSGRFRGSVQVTANYRKNLLQFSYNPLYSSLQAYGYRPDLQVKRSIREVAQQLYAREFNIIKKAGI